LYNEQSSTQVKRGRKSNAVNEEDGAEPTCIILEA
jgi:hypothetical protein